LIHKSASDLAGIRRSVATVGRLSDNLLRVGPFRLGLDGVLSWVPGIGEIYSMGAAVFIIVQGVRARVPVHILLGCAALMGSRTLISAVPLAGPLAADLFLAHRLSAKMVVRAIDKMLPGGAPPASEPQAGTGRTHLDHLHRSGHGARQAAGNICP
jgi:hypothetical protein